MAGDLDLLQGYWAISTLEIEGRKANPGTFAGAGIEVKGNKFNSLSMGAKYGGILELDETTAPKSLRLKFKTGPEKGHTNFGIYDLKGSQWRICLSMTGGPAPASFATAPGSGHALETLIRQSAPSTAAAPPDPRFTDSSPVPELQGEWRMLSCVRDGQTMHEGFVSSGRRVVKGTGTTIRFGNQVFMSGTMAVDASKDPVEFDILHTKGSDTGKIQRGIYILNGPEWRICLSPPNGERPADFNSAPGDGRTLVTWTKVK